MTTDKTIKRTESGSIQGVGGRPPGSRNKTTLFKEAMREGFENKLEKDGMRVFDAVVQKAIEGDMAAAKMIMDRVVPVQEQSSGVKGAGNIVINVSGMEAKIGVMDSGESGALRDEKVIDQEPE